MKCIQCLRVLLDEPERKLEARDADYVYDGWSVCEMHAIFSLQEEEDSGEDDGNGHNLPGATSIG